MSIFDQRGQDVSYQYNAAGDINFSGIQNLEEFITELERFKAKVSNAATAQVIDDQTAADINDHLSRAIQQTKKVKPNRNAVIDHINNAKTIIESFSSASNLVTGLIAAAELARKFFNN